MHSPEEILLSLRKFYATLELLETSTVTDKRYKEKQIVIFEYVNIGNEKCVLKYYSLELVDNSDKEKEKNSLLEEFRCIKRLGSTPHVVRLYDANELWIENVLVGVYMTMEKFDGTLSSLMKEKQLFSSAEVADFLRQMNVVLDLAHYRIKQPIIHADIKPSNIGYRTIDKDVYEYALMDFDISVSPQTNELNDSIYTLSSKGSIRGVTLNYAPPEQILSYINQHGSISNRVDIYAVGAVAIEMLTGVAPMHSETQIYYELPLQKLSKDWNAILGYLVQADPKLRVKRISEAFAHTDTSRGTNRNLYRPALLLLSLTLVAAMITTMYFIDRSNTPTEFVTSNAMNRELDTQELTENQASQNTESILNNHSNIEVPQTTYVPDTGINNDLGATQTNQRSSNRGIVERNITDTPTLNQAINTADNPPVVNQYGTASHGFDARVIIDRSVNSYIYNTVLAKWGGAGGSNYWITQNLGSITSPTIEADVTVSNSGWYFQFNNPLAFSKNEGNTWNTNQVPGGWSAPNDPCRVLLGNSWRIPTVTEWENFARAPVSSGGISRGTASAAFNSLLKLHTAGYLNSEQGKITQYRDAGLFWTSSEATSTSAYAIVVGNRNAAIREVPKAAALSIRCIQRD